jgi:D-alanyl-D-alanine carboxypeptidase
MTYKFGTITGVFARFVAAAVLAITLSVTAFAGGKFAAVTVDARTGDILFSKDMDGIRHPASLTKMMTLYIIFEELKSGRIKLSTPLNVSSRAAKMAPSKLALKPGTTITVETAIKALVIKSANDVAAVVGENLEGTEGAFAARMTRTARSIGMSRTTYRNASGLPNPGQVTTARDQATLGLRLMRDFPQYYPYFRAQSFTFRGRTIRTHNRLVGRFQGTDGIKTGYINASGYNLVTSVKRDDKRLVGVVLGGRTAGARNSYMVSMLSKQFQRARKGNTIAAVAGSSKGAVNPLVVAATSAKPVIAPSSQQLEELAEQASEDPKSTAVLEAKLDENTDEAEGDDIATASTDPIWDIRVGEFANKKSAKRGIDAMRTSFSGDLTGKNAVTEMAQNGKKVRYSARFSGFTHAAAKTVCAKLAVQGRSCQVVQPEG